MGMQHEAVDYNDPLSILLAAEDEDNDERESFFEAGLHRAKSFEREREEADTCGLSPFELDHPEEMATRQRCFALGHAPVKLRTVVRKHATSDIVSRM